MRQAVVALLAVVSLAPPIDAAAQSAVVSFAALSSILRARQHVMVTDAGGGTHRGTLVAITATDMTIQSRSLLRRSERVFREQNVRRVHLAESDWDATLIGLGVGAVVTGIGVKTCDSRDCLWFGLAPAVGALTGGLIDRSMNRLVFQSPPIREDTASAAAGGAVPSQHLSFVVGDLAGGQTPPRITVVPILNGNRTGAMVRLRLGGS